MNELIYEKTRLSSHLIYNFGKYEKKIYSSFLPHVNINLMELEGGRLNNTHLSLSRLYSINVT